MFVVRLSGVSTTDCLSLHHLLNFRLTFKYIDYYILKLASKSPVFFLPYYFYSIKWQEFDQKILFLRHYTMTYKNFGLCIK
jgi:hypothetical protein